MSKKGLKNLILGLCTFSIAIVALVTSYAIIDGFSFLFLIPSMLIFLFVTGSIAVSGIYALAKLETLGDDVEILKKKIEELEKK